MDLTYRKTGVQHRYGNTYVGYRAPLEVVDFPHPPALAVVTTVHVGDFSSSCTGNATDLHAILVHRIRGVIRLLLLSTGSFYPLYLLLPSDVLRRISQLRSASWPPYVCHRKEGFRKLEVFISRCCPHLRKTDNRSEECLMFFILMSFLEF